MYYNFSATLENPISHHKLLVMFLICNHMLDVLRSMKHLRGKHTISIKVACCFVLVSLIVWSNLFVFPQFSLRGRHLYPLERTVWHSTAQEKKTKTQTKHGGIKKQRRPNLNEFVCAVKTATVCSCDDSQDVIFLNIWENAFHEHDETISMLLEEL